MSTDIELLELAAKAAGIRYTVEDDEYYKTRKFFGLWLVYDYEPSEHARRHWNPLTNDGDALRLAVKLRIDLHTTPINGDAVLVTAKHRMRSDLLRLPNPTQSAELYQPDPYAATRRAIVRAAAALSRGT